MILIERKATPMAGMTKRQRLNRNMMNKIKTDKGCELCGYKEHHVALQFDHIDPESKYRDANGNLKSPSSMFSYSQATILAEIQKCRILCANCHAVHSYESEHYKKR
jgi:hypothetical protein